jgi:probable DNA repair protein
MAADVFDHVRQGDTLVCASSRLARRLKNQYAQSQIRRGRHAWETPDILPWAAWLVRCWTDRDPGGTHNGMLLGPEQQLYIWQQLIQQSGYSHRLLQVTATARQALHAWNTTREWQIPVFPAGLSLNEDAVAFLSWSQAYRQYCQDHSLIDTADIAELLTADRPRVPHMNPIALAGFDQLNPMQRTLIEALAKAGTDVQVIPHERRNEAVSATMQPDNREEIRAAALWCRRLLQSGAGEDIGIVVPDLRARYARIENTFDDILTPGAILAGHAAQVHPYSITLGLPLTRYPVIKTALDILDLGDRPVPLPLISAVLRSPFVGAAATEHQGRAQLDACLHKYGEHRMALRSLKDIAVSHLPAEVIPRKFLDYGHHYLEMLRSAGGKRPVYDWAALFSGLLARCGWPGDRTLDSAEYQTVVEWYSILEKFAAVDPAAAKLSYREALAQLRQLAGGAGFQPQTPEAPVQIMGMTGAAGMHFDHLWVMGLDEESWPYQAHPISFIPIGLQRGAGLPTASAELALAQASHDTQRLIQSARDTVLSYPGTDQDRPLRPSPLIRPYLQAWNPSPDHGPDYASLLFASRCCEYTDDMTAPVIPAGQAVSGGTALFGDQAACPFRACARHRLHAEGLEHRDIGLDARDRGSLIHDVMRRLWGRLKDHAALLAASGAELDDAVNKAVRAALAAYRNKLPLTLSASFVRLESARIGALVQDWLDLERQRRPFRVSAREFRHRISLGDIEVSTRIDRIDVLDDGRSVIIDYKTGDPGITAWLGERPDEPQLPLYAVTSGGDIAAVAFAKLKRGQSAFVGVAQQQGLLPGVVTVDGLGRSGAAIPDWHALFDAWRDALNRLAQAFRRGDARVDPKGPDTCRYCDLHALCRIYERDALSISRGGDHV